MTGIGLEAAVQRQKIEVRLAPARRWSLKRRQRDLTPVLR